MKIAIMIVLILFALCEIWFWIPYSALKSRFAKDVSDAKNATLYGAEDVFAASDFQHLPKVIQDYIEANGYLGKPKMNYLKMEYHSVDFSQGRSGPNLTIDYTQYDFVKEPGRLALIKSGVAGIPFQGYDYYLQGKGGMKGVVAKLFTLFHQTGDEMDRACLATFLAESMFVPTVLLQDYIKFEEVNDLQVRATISYYGQTVSGIFTFNEDHEMVSFTTDDRAVVDTDGTVEYVPWSALCSNYKVDDDEIRKPTLFQAVWNYPDGDFVYFDGKINEISYDTSSPT